MRVKEEGAPANPLVARGGIRNLLCARDQEGTAIRVVKRSLTTTTARDPPSGKRNTMSDNGMDVDGLLEEDIEVRNEPLAASSSRADHSEALEMLEDRARGRNMAVPTDDARVRRRLRGLNEPITLFGERPPDRRERLREIMVRLSRESGEIVESEEEEGEPEVR